MGFVRKHTGLDLTGGGASDAAGHAARLAEGQQREGLAILREDLAPFRQAGTEAAGMLMGGVFQDPTQADYDQILNNPFFKALSDQQNEQILSERAALGLAGSGGTASTLNKNMLMLGRDFLNDRMMRNQQRFNQLMGISDLGQASATQSGISSLNTMTNIGDLMGVPGMLKAQEKANQGSQFMQAMGGFNPSSLMSMFGGGGAVGAGTAAGGMAGLGTGSAIGGAGMGMLPGMGGAGAMAGGLTSGIQGALLASDRRLKKDIVKVGQDKFGNLYHFRYKNDHTGTLYRGRIAQELMENRPDAVTVGNDGFYRVTPEFIAYPVIEVAA